MSVTGSVSAGIPQILLHEMEALVVSVELKTGEICRGRLTRAEDSFNLHMNKCMITDELGTERYVEKCFIRGDRIRFIVCPPILEKAPMFERVLTFMKHKGRKGVPVGNSQGYSTKKTSAKFGQRS